MFLMFVMMCFKMVVLRPRPTVGSSGAGEGSGLGSGAEHVDEQTREFFTSVVTHIILEQTPVIFGSNQGGFSRVDGGEAEHISC